MPSPLRKIGNGFRLAEVYFLLIVLTANYNLEENLMNTPFYSGADCYPPRYYQRNAVNRTLEAIAKQQTRILIAMATGTGKTYTAFQLVWRLIESGTKKKVLYLADRNNLVN